MPIDISTYPQILRDALATAAPGWAPAHDQGDPMGSVEDAVVSAIDAEVAGQHAELDQETLERESNRLTTYLRGFGTDFLWINENLPDDRTIGSYATIGEYDRDKHDYQEAALAESRTEWGNDPVPASPYRGRLSDWIRFIENDRLVYGNMSTLAGHMFDEIENGFSEALAKAVPHDYDMDVEDAVVSDHEPVRRTRICARTVPPGREALLEDLQKFMRERENAVWNVLHDRFGSDGRGAVWRHANKWDDDMQDFVFSDTTAIEAVRPGSFLSDCATLQRPKEEFDAIVDSVVPAAVEEFVGEMEARIVRWNAANAPVAEPA